MISPRKIEWEAIAGLIAAITGITLHLLDVTDANILRVITLVLVSLLFLRDLRGEERWEAIGSDCKLSVKLLEEIKAGLHPAEIDLIGPSRLRSATAQFAGRARGEVVWFNACSQMLDSHDLLAAILHPFLANPGVTKVRFVLDEAERAHWESKVRPVLEAMPEGRKVEPPSWGNLESGISFVIAETDAEEGKAEALVSFWGEPFMAVHHDRRMPGYIIHVREHSELVGRLREVERASRGT
jgi:hypothetical protein